jgi:hypothetical protein
MQELPQKATDSLDPLCKLLTLSCELKLKDTSDDADVVDKLLLEDGEASLLVDGLQVGVDAASLHDYLQQRVFLFNICLWGCRAYVWLTKKNSYSSRKVYV